MLDLFRVYQNKNTAIEAEYGGKMAASRNIDESSCNLSCHPPSVLEPLPYEKYENQVLLTTTLPGIHRLLFPLHDTVVVALRTSDAHIPTHVAQVTVKAER